MKRQNRLNEQTLEKARKEREKVIKLTERINKAKAEIQKIQEENNWMAYLGQDFCSESTEEQQIEFFNEFKMIR